MTIMKLQNQQLNMFLILSLQVFVSWAATVPLTKDTGLTTTGAGLTTGAYSTTTIVNHNTTSVVVEVDKRHRNETDDKAEELSRPVSRLERAVYSIHLVALNYEHVKYPLVFTLVVIFAGLSKIVFHHLHFLSSKIPESCCLIIIGLVWGLIIYYSDIGTDMEFFSPNEFFLFLLPPIILESAFSLHDRTFAENIGSVLLFAVLGTVTACFAVGLTLFGLYKAGAMEEINCSLIQILVFSALIVAVDPVAVLAVFQEVGVNNVLYFLVFGESLLNDGVTVVLYDVMQKLNRMEEISPPQIVLGVAKFFVVVLCGLAIGVFCGILSSLLTKFSNAVKVVEPLLIFGFAYLSYVLSELFEVSGIISMIGCGIVQAHYAFLNITTKSRAAVKFFAKVMSTTCEIIIFLFLGLITWKNRHVWVTGFSIWTLVLCIFYRFLITFSLSCLINKLDTSRVRKIKYDEMFMMSYGGLRGAVCFSLVALLKESEFPMKNMFVDTTIFVIFFTVFIQGGTVKWLVHLLSVKLEEQSKYISLNMELTEHVSDHVLAGIESIVGQAGSHYFKEQVNMIDDMYIRPKLQQNATTSDLEDITRHYEKLVMKEHLKHLQLCGAKMPKTATDLRHLDSEAVLANLTSEDEQPEPKRQGDIPKKPPSKAMWKKAVKKVKAVKKIEELPADNRRVRALVRNYIEHSKERPQVKVFRNNSIRDRQGSFINHMRQKHNKNKELNQLKSSMAGKQHLPPPRIRLSVPDASSDVDAQYIDVDDDPACGIHINVENVDKEEGGDDDNESGKIFFHAHRPSGSDMDEEFKGF